MGPCLRGRNGHTGTVQFRMEIGRHDQSVLSVPCLDDLSDEALSAHLSPKYAEPVELGHNRSVVADR